MQGAFTSVLIRVAPIIKHNYTTYKGGLVVIEFPCLQYKPPSSPILGSESRPTHFIHPSFVVHVPQLETWDQESWIGPLATSTDFFSNELRLWEGGERQEGGMVSAYRINS